MLVHKNNTLKFIAKKIIVYVMHYRFLTLIVNFETVKYWKNILNFNK